MRCFIYCSIKYPHVSGTPNNTWHVASDLRVGTAGSVRGRVLLEDLDLIDVHPATLVMILRSDLQVNDNT